MVMRDVQAEHARGIEAAMLLEEKNARLEKKFKDLQELRLAELARVKRFAAMEGAYRQAEAKFRDEFKPKDVGVESLVSKKLNAPPTRTGLVLYDDQGGDIAPPKRKSPGDGERNAPTAKRLMTSIDAQDDEEGATGTPNATAAENGASQERDDGDRSATARNDSGDEEEYMRPNKRD